jgi:predicted transcriptional regulator
MEMIVPSLTCRSKGGDEGSAGLEPVSWRGCGYTKGMKTAVSIPDDVFEGAEQLARRTKKSRSQLFSDAVSEYVARHAPEEVTDAMDRVCAELGHPADPIVSSASRRVLARSEW